MFAPPPPPSDRTVYSIENKEDGVIAKVTKWKQKIYIVNLYDIDEDGDHINVGMSIKYWRRSARDNYRAAVFKAHEIAGVKK